MTGLFGHTTANTSTAGRETGWRDRAACAGLNPLMWDETGGRDLVAAGIQICLSCPVAAQCADHADNVEGKKYPDGTVWAGRLYVRGKARDLNSTTARRSLTDPDTRARTTGGRLCAICGAPVPARRKRYCGNTCANRSQYANHDARARQRRAERAAKEGAA